MSSQSFLYYTCDIGVFMGRCFGINNRLSLSMYCSPAIYAQQTFLSLKPFIVLFWEFSLSVNANILVSASQKCRCQSYLLYLYLAYIWNSMVQYGFEVPYFLYQYFVMVCINSWIFNISFTILLIFTVQYPFNIEFESHFVKIHHAKLSKFLRIFSILSFRSFKSLIGT